MLRKLRMKIKGQSTAEYAILIALVVAAIIAMQKYAQRALQARVRDAAQYMVGQTNTIGNSYQYEPYYLTTNYVVNKTADETSFLIGNQQIGGVGRSGSTTTLKEAGGQTVYEFDLNMIGNGSL